MRPGKLFAYFGHHKCATTWVIEIIRLVCRDLAFNFVNVTSAQCFNYDLSGFVTENDIDFIAYTNTDIAFVNLDHFLGFHIIRDPRDIIVSAYFSHLYSHPTDEWPALVEHRKRLEAVSREEGLFLEMEFSKKEFEDLYKWNYDRPNICEIKMEDLIQSPERSMLKAFSHLGLVDEETGLVGIATYRIAAAINNVHRKSRKMFPIHVNTDRIPVSILLRYIYQNRFEKIAEGRKPGDEDIKSHYRKGVAGDWINYFNAEHRNYFRANYSDLLVKLGYETSPDW